MDVKDYFAVVLEESNEGGVPFAAMTGGLGSGGGPWEFFFGGLIVVFSGHGWKGMAGWNGFMSDYWVVIIELLGGIAGLAFIRIYWAGMDSLNH